MNEPEILALAKVDARLAPRPWAWAEANRLEIDAHWARLTASNPALYNGRVLLLSEREIAGGVMTGTYLETDYASFLALRDFGFPDPTVGNCFAMAALRAADGAFLLGVMGAHTANAGRIYFPAGTPDPDDVMADGRVDLLGSVGRELEEETGLTAADVAVDEGWTAVLEGPRTALLRLVRSPLPATQLRDRILGFLAREDTPELADIRIVREPADIDPAGMPGFIQAYLRHAL